MLPIDWKVVYQKADELYPRYRRGLKFSELASELAAQGLDAQHINYVVEELNKRHAEEKQRQINWPLALLSFLIALVSIVALIFILSKGYIVVASGLGICLFLAVRMLLKKKSLPKASHKWRMDNNDTK